VELAQGADLLMPRVHLWPTRSENGLSASVYLISAHGRPDLRLWLGSEAYSCSLHLSPAQRWSGKCFTPEDLPEESPRILANHLCRFLFFQWDV